MAQKTSSGIRVFVYGTLKRGHPNHSRCGMDRAEFLGRCYIEGPYTMLNLHAYPGVVRDTTRTPVGRIFGEVYRIDDDLLATLDILEGHPDFYERVKVDTPWKKTWIYLLPESYLTEGFTEVCSGLWRPSEDEEEFAEGVAA